MAKANQNFSAYQETQPIDSNPSSPSDSGEDKDSLLGDCDTQPFEDDAWINDQYMETQVIDIECDNEEFLLCNETQAVDLGFENGEEVFVEGTQLLEASDGLATQVLDLCDDEVVVDSEDDVTDVLEDNSELSDSDDSCSKAETVLSSEENRQDANEKVKSTVALDANWSNEHGVSGKKVARFASVRSSAFRASAVAARAANPNTDCSTLINCHSSGKGATHNSSLENSVGEVGNQQSLTSIFVEEKNDLRTANKTARKLFIEDLPEENCHSTDGNVDLGNLSYIDSQEPGEASQASALNLVDKLISECRLEFDFEVEADYGRKTEEKSKFVQIFKGPQELAKKVSYKSGAVGNDIFDWDDNREDEGGGDIYRRRKDEFFGVASKRREFSSLPREQKRELIPVAVDKRRASDSKLLQHSVTRSRKNIQGAKKNLGKELDEVREAVVLGNYTQVAAEAIDDLSSGACGKFDAEASCLTGKKLSPGEERGFSPGGVVTRQSKGTKRIQAMSKDELLKKRMKKASPSPAKACRRNIEGSLKGDQLDKEAEPISKTKSTRKRRDLGSIRVLFSQHLDEDVTKHQKKILARFDISEASSMKEATHFLADNFTRTRNMLEAIASGKPVVTTQWLESIDQVSIYVDEDMYILRDSKKEKEFCFNMGVSLARARQFPLLQGRRVFITPNTKPGLNTITTLVKAVHGLPVERLGRSALSEDKVPENLLVLSCEEDRATCIPFLERGAEVYSSELLLNGIVTQRLEYERYRLFTDHVRRTRSTIWIKDGKGKFQRRSG
ncbi:unnamed protein product [Arabidopsis lyrata]|nr:unnamed protein product [Arabidopsis lyrata]